MPSERLFIDTNVLLAATVPARRGHQTAAALLVEGPRRGVSLVSSGQVLREYMAVATRPIAANGLGLACGQAADNADQLASRLELLDEERSVAAVLRRLVREDRVQGRQVHDASIVATMLAHGLRALVTDDVGDFARFADRIAVHALLGWQWPTG